MPKFGIQILNHNGGKWLPGLLSSLQKCDYPDKVLYLVDNGSTDGSVELARESTLNFRIVELGENKGFAGAYNQTAELAWQDGCDWLCLLNTDTLICPGWLAAVANVISVPPDYGILGPVQLDWERDEISSFMTSRYPQAMNRITCDPPTPDRVDADWIEGCCFFVSKTCWTDMDGFDERFYFYWEDADLCRRAIRRGWNVGLVTDSHIRHFGGGSSNNGDDRERPLKQRYYYLHKLADPNRHFLRNGLSLLRLYATELGNIANRPGRRKALKQWLGDVFWIVRKWPLAWSKWRTDRARPALGGN